MLRRAARATLVTLLDPFEGPADRPDQPALVFVRPGAQPMVVSRAAFRAGVARQGAALAALGARAGQVVIVAHVDGPEAVYAFWAALWIGAIPSMFPASTERLDPQAYRASLRILVRQSGARTVLTSDELVPALAELVGCRTIGFGRLQAAEGPGTGPVHPEPDAVAFLQHSSGTTGLQKGVALSHRAVLNQIAAYSDALDLQQSDVVVSWLPLYHDMGLIAGFLLPLLQGLPLVLMSPFDWVRRPALLLQCLHEHRGTLCWLPNFAYNHCVLRVLEREVEGLSLGHVRAFVNCSEPVLQSSHAAFLQRFARLGVRADQLGVSYAMAENVFAVTQTPPGRPPRVDAVDRTLLASEGRAEPIAPGAATASLHTSCGPPIPDVEVRIAGGLEERRVGEIEVRSNCMLSGYHGRPDLDARAFDQGWYRTGDLGYLADGELYVVGREKDLIISGGKNLHPHDLEAALHSVAGLHPGRAVVFGVPDEREGTELVAVVAEVDGDDPARRPAIVAAIRRALVERTGIAASYVELVGPKWLLKTSSGKIARAANREKWLAQRAGQGQ